MRLFCCRWYPFRKVFSFKSEGCRDCYPLYEEVSECYSAQLGYALLICESPGEWIQQRYVLVGMGFLAIANAYTMRICLSIAITEMVAMQHVLHYDPDACPGNPHVVNITLLQHEGTFTWNEETQGLILSSFFWGYVLTHLPGGILAEKLGGKHFLGLGLLCTAVFTLLTPLAAVHGGAELLIAVRVLEGLGEGITFPAMNALLARWVPPHERSCLGSFVYAGSLVGTVVGTMVSGLLIQYAGWQSVFYTFGGAGVVWYVIWTLVCYSNPASHPCISLAERRYLEQTIVAVHKEVPPIPWKSISRSVPLWGLICAQIGHDWGFFTMATDLPKYMSDVLKFSVAENGLLCALPFLAMWLCSVGSGWLCDVLITNGNLTVTAARKAFTTVASVGPAVGILAASYAGCDKTAVITLIIVAMGLMGTFYPGIKVNCLDLSPNYAGTLMAIVNGIGAVAGIITPYLIGILTPDSTLKQWRLVFWISAVVVLVTYTAFLFTCSGEVQAWNEPPTKGPECKTYEEEQIHKQNICYV